MIAILTPLLYSLGPLAILLVMAVVFAETGLLVGFFLPGDSLLFLAGALVASQVIPLPIWVLAAGVFVAAVAGDQLGFLIGRHYGPRVFSRPDSRLFRQENAARAQAFFARRGALAVILGRFVPVVRTFVPVVAGVAKMPRCTFTGLNLLGAVVWAVGIVAAGFFFGGITFVAAHIELITIAIAGVSVIPAAAEVMRRRRGTPRPKDALLRRKDPRSAGIGGRGTWRVGRDDLEAYIDRTCADGVRRIEERPYTKGDQPAQI